MKWLLCLLCLPSMLWAQKATRAPQDCDTVVVYIQPTLPELLTMLKAHEAFAPGQYLTAYVSHYEVRGFNHLVTVVIYNKAKMLAYADVPFYVKNLGSTGKTLNQERFIMQGVLPPGERDTMIVNMPSNLGLGKYVAVPDTTTLRGH